MKRKIVVLVICIIAIIGGLVGIKSYRQQERQKDIDSYLTVINDNLGSFDATDNDDEKLAILSKVNDDFAEFKKEDKPYTEVAEVYQKSIEKMQSYFINVYNTILSDNSITDISSMTDKNDISKRKENLNGLVTRINEESGLVFSDKEDEATALVEKCTELIATYDDRIVAIEKEEEEKKKAEEEAKAQAEAEEAKRKAEETKAHSHYENEYFSVDVPESWGSDWTVTETVNGTTKIFVFYYNGGGGTVTVLPNRGSYMVAKGDDTGAGFFSRGATLTPKVNGGF